MKKGILLLAILFCFFSSNQLWGAATYTSTSAAKINLQTMNGTDNYLSIDNFNGNDQGTKSNTDYFHIKAAEAWVSKNNGSDITGGEFYYRIYKQGGATGGFTMVSFSWQEENGSGTVFQKWGNYGIDIDVLAGVNSAGVWVFECYWSAPTNGVDCSNPIFLNDGSNNYTFTFTADASLPVELTKFQATPTQSNIALNWQTAMELNNDYFSVEKSENGTDFRSIGEVLGAGSTLEIQNYNFIDEHPNAGMNYYRLKQVDFNGDFEYSEMVAVEYSKNKSAQFFPNPVRDELAIRTTSNNTNISIYNVQGQLVRQLSSLTIDGQYLLNMSDLDGGLYFVQLTDGETGALIAQQRVVKE